jgi:hypothetical protein
MDCGATKTYEILEKESSPKSNVVCLAAMQEHVMPDA